MSASLELVLLGTGSLLPNPDPCGAGQVVIAGQARMPVGDEEDDRCAK